MEAKWRGGWRPVGEAQRMGGAGWGDHELESPQGAGLATAGTFHPRKVQATAWATSESGNAEDLVEEVRSVWARPRSG